MILRLSADIGILDGCTLTLFSSMAMRMALSSRTTPHGGEDVVAVARADEVVLAEAAWPDGARRRRASPFSNVTIPETAHWLMMAVGRDDIQEGYKLKLQTLR